MTHPFNNEFINVIKHIYKERYGFEDELNVLHELLTTELFNESREDILKIKTLGSNDRESVFYRDYHHFIDTNVVFNDVYTRFINNHIKPLFSNNGPVIVQKTPNIRISFPNSTAIGKHEKDTYNTIGIHKDSDFGHHPDEINIIIPITSMFDTNSIYYEPTENSNLPIHQYNNLKLNIDSFFVGSFNKLLHFNKINKTGVTRISLDFRIILYENYMKNIKSFENTKFELGKYFIVA